MQERTVLDKESTNAWKGIFIVAIFIHHYVQRMGQPGFLFPYSWVGYLAVSGFFLFSGYGLMTSLMKKEGYLDGFLLQKSLRVYLPTITATLMVGVIASLLGFGNLGVGDIALRSLTLTLITNWRLNWYVTATLIFYLFFFLSFKWLPAQKGLPLLFLLNSLYAVVGWGIGLGDYWINTALVFPLGCLLAYRKNWFLKQVQKHYWAWVILAVFGFLIPFTIGALGLFYPFIMNSFAGMLFGLMIALFSIQFKVKSRLFSFFGAISFELYLVHSQLFDIFHQTITIYTWAGTLAMFGSIILLSYGLNNLNRTWMLWQRELLELLDIRQNQT